MANHSLLKSLALRLSLLAFLAGARATSQCYYPNGDKAEDLPCYTDGRITHCCGSDSICLTNQLCLSLDQPFLLSRGSCTDPSWGTSCPSICVNAQQGAGAALIPYLNGTTSADEEPTYCCNSVVISGNDTLVCSKVGSTDPSPFPIANGSVIVDVAGLNGLVRQSSSTGSSTIANNTGNDNTSKKLNSSDGSQKEVAIGAGVGVPLGVIALLSIVWALYERRLRKKIPQPAPAPAGYYGYASRPSASPLELAELTASEPKPAELDNSTMKTYR